MEGSIRLGGQELAGLSERDMRPIRGGRMTMIFQDPMLALNPVLRVRDQVRESMRAHGVKRRPGKRWKWRGSNPRPGYCRHTRTS